jgi:NitT/TauT family transport system ATP-binding protein
MINSAAMPQTAAGQPSGRPLIRLSHVDKIYGDGTVAVRDFNLNIGNAEFVSLLGPSGCGKSTILRMIAGLGDISSGTIDWPQPDHDGSHDPKREIGFVFQEPTLMPWATVFENVYLPLKLDGVKKTAARDEIMTALETVELADFAGAYPRQLSGGMKMRVSIARALITKPSLLLMDEPFAALDEITRIKLNNDLLDLWSGQNWTVIFVTHSVYESVYLSNRIVVMAARPGRVIADIAIEAPYPRDETYRTSEHYNQYCRKVSAQLHLAMGDHYVSE